MEGDQLLEGAALVERRVVEAADQDVGGVLEPVAAAEVPSGVRREPRERVAAFDLAGRQVARPARTEYERALRLGSNEHPADVRM